MRILGLCGRIGAGKTTAADYIRHCYGLDSLSFVEMLIAPVLEKRALEISRKNLQRVGRELYLKHGDIALTDMLLSRANEERAWIVDDIRYASTAQHIRRRSPCGFYMIAIEASERVRYARVKARQRESIASIDEFRQLDAAPTELQIGRVVETADVVVHNYGSLAELRQQCDSIMQRVVRKWEQCES